MNRTIEMFPNSHVQTISRIINTPSEAALKSLLYLQETGHIKIIKSHTTQRKALNSYLMVIVRRGKGYLDYSGHSYALTSGSCFFIDCSIPHKYSSDTKDPWELMWIHFNGFNANYYYNLFCENNKNAFKLKKYEEALLIISDIIKTFDFPDKFTEIKISELITRLLTLIITSQSSAESESSPSFNAIKKYIDETYTSRITLDDICEKFYISKYYLSREFKAKFGITISKYINSKRITYAKELLRFSDLTIEQISERAGIYDANYFTKIFKNAEYILPSEYRKKWQA